MTLLLTGAPCAGKTETLHRLGDLLTRHGVRVVATPEVATELFLNERKLSAARFQQEVLERQLANEAAAAAHCEAHAAAGNDVLWVLDRGAYGASPAARLPLPAAACRGRVRPLAQLTGAAAWRRHPRRKALL